MTGSADAAAKETVSTATAGGVKVTTGKQITGYFVEALQAGATAEQLAKYGK
jgi:hypothetical protein